MLSGGVSVGAYDVVRDVLAAAGGTFRHVRMQPGKPQGWAVWAGTPVVALPGNPLSASLSYEMFVRPLLDRILGRAARPGATAVAETGWTSPAGRRQLVPVVVSCGPAACQETLRTPYRAALLRSTFCASIKTPLAYQNRIFEKVRRLKYARLFAAHSKYYDRCGRDLCQGASCYLPLLLSLCIPSLLLF